MHTSPMVINGQALSSLTTGLMVGEPTQAVSQYRVVFPSATGQSLFTIEATSPTNLWTLSSAQGVQSLTVQGAGHPIQLPTLVWDGTGHSLQYDTPLLPGSYTVKVGTEVFQLSLPDPAPLVTNVYRHREKVLCAQAEEASARALRMEAALRGLKWSVPLSAPSQKWPGALALVRRLLHGAKVATPTASPTLLRDNAMLVRDSIRKALGHEVERRHIGITVFVVFDPSTRQILDASAGWHRNSETELFLTYGEQEFVTIKALFEHPAQLHANHPTARLATIALNRNTGALSGSSDHDGTGVLRRAIDLIGGVTHFADLLELAATTPPASLP